MDIYPLQRLYICQHLLRSPAFRLTLMNAWIVVLFLRTSQLNPLPCAR